MAQSRVNELQTIIENANKDISFFNRNEFVFDTFEDFVQFIDECDEEISYLSDELKQHQVLKIESLQTIQVLIAENKEALEQWYATEDYDNDELRAELKGFFRDRLINVENVKQEYSPQHYELIATAINALNSVKGIAIRKYEIQTDKMQNFYIRFINDETKEFGYGS